MPLDLSTLPAAKRQELEQLLAERDKAQQRDPVLFFRPNPCRNCGERYGNPRCEEHRIPQHLFLNASTPVIAAFAGNRLGKTTVLTIKAYLQHLPTDVLPDHLKPYKRVTHSEPVIGWLLCPSAKVAESVTIPALRKWAPRSFLLGNSFDRAWDKQHSYLRFKDGGRLHVFTYEMEASKLVGAAIDYAGYDEPVPEQHREECLYRLPDRNGFEMFAMTPVNMAGGGIGWIYRKVWKRREDPNLTVIQGSIHDNPLLDRDAVMRILEETGEEGDPQRRAREFGEFVHIGGMVYPNGFDSVLFEMEGEQQGDRFVPATSATEHVKGWNVLVGIDPGLKNCALVWGGFDSDNNVFIFDEVRLRDKTTRDYAEAIKATNRKWGITHPSLYVIDPSARNRSLVNKENVQAELLRHGIPAIPGQNAVEAGVQQIRRRMAANAFHVASHCRELRDEAEEYRAHDDPSGEFRVVKERDHGLDATRYLCAQRPFYVFHESQNSRLGWDPKAQTVGRIRSVRESGPLGSLA